MALDAQTVVQQALVLQLGSEKVSNVIHWINDDEITETGLLTDFQDIEDKIWAEYKKFVWEDHNLLGSVWSAPRVPSFGTRTTTATSAGGAVPGNAGQSTSYFIIRKYALLDGPTSRGRFLACGFPEEYTHVNQMTANAVVLATDLANALKTVVNAPFVNWTPVIYSRKEEQWSPVFKTTIDPIVRSYHGRQSKSDL